MGLPMYVSPSLSKRQLPPKQPQSPPYTPYEDTDFAGEPYQNSRTSAFGNRRYFLHRNVSSPALPYNGEYSVYGGGVNGAGSYRSSELSPTDQQPIIDIPELLQPRNSVSQQPPHNNQPRRIRSSSVSYNNLVQQHIQRLHHLQHLHRTREQQLASSNLATRRGMQSAHLLSLNRAQQFMQVQQQQQAALAAVAQNLFPTHEDQQESQDEIIDLNFEEVPSVQTPLQPSHNGVALDSVFRRVNLLRQLVQQDNRVMRPTSRQHRSSSSSHGRISNTRILTSPSSAQTREEILQGGIDAPRFIRVQSTQVPPPTFSHIPNQSLPPVPRRLPAWHSIRRGANFSNESRSLVDEEFYPTDIPLNAFEYDSESSIENGHTSRILSPIPRRYDPTLTTVFSTAPHSTLVSESGDRIDVDSSANSNYSRGETIRQEQRSSASGEVC
ncbi:4930_t:CDS:2 [Cetraspora pellucida]|uniref:4930_t:CDS:1 n=1 Tax=Cetraspora pellucida TaxID=1433469 RepID=A0A9N8ZKV7_9GLOM|nr:4930_t:CDS:2 [Cetraspora pellucida]